MPTLSCIYSLSLSWFTEKKRLIPNLIHHLHLTRNVCHVPPWRIFFFSSRWSDSVDSLQQVPTIYHQRKGFFCVSSTASVWEWGTLHQDVLKLYHYFLTHILLEALLYIHCAALSASLKFRHAQYRGDGCHGWYLCMVFWISFYWTQTTYFLFSWSGTKIARMLQQPRHIFLL